MSVTTNGETALPFTLIVNTSELNDIEDPVELLDSSDILAMFPLVSNTNPYEDSKLPSISAKVVDVSVSVAVLPFTVELRSVTLCEVAKVSVAVVSNSDDAKASITFPFSVKYL